MNEVNVLFVKICVICGKKLLRRRRKPKSVPIGVIRSPIDAYAEAPQVPA
jgi:hypothetical protein